MRPRRRLTVRYTPETRPPWARWGVRVEVEGIWYRVGRAGHDEAVIVEESAEAEVAGPGDLVCSACWEPTSPGYCDDLGGPYSACCEADLARLDMFGDARAR